MKKITKNIAIIVAVVFSIMFFYGCHLWTPSKECKDINLVRVEKIITSLEKEGKIRPDQADARKKDMRESWNSFSKGQLTCKELRNKAFFHTDGIYP